MWELKTAVEELRSTYQSIDLRAIVFYSVDNRQWYCGFMMMTFTNKSKEEVLNEYKTIKQNSEIPNGRDLKVILEYNSIDQVDRLFSELDDMRITLDGETYVLPTTLSQGLSRKQNTLSRDTTIQVKSQEPDKDYDYRVFTIMRNVFGGFRGLFEFNKVDLNKYNIKPDEFSNFFNIDFIPENINIIMVFPLYLKKYSTNGGNRVIDSFYIHKKLVDKITFKVTAIIDGNTYSKNRDLKIVKDHNQMVVGELSYDSNIEDGNVFKIRISHTVLGDITEYQLTGRQIRESKVKLVTTQESITTSKVVNLAPVFRAFNWYELFKKNLKGKDESKQVQAVTQLFSLLGYASINLATFGKPGEQLTDSPISHSADIIMMNPIDNSHYLIDCTITVPNETKINKIKNRARYLNGKYGTDFKPVIVTGEPMEVTENAIIAKVIIINSDHTDMLLNSLENESMQFANSKLLEILQPANFEDNI